MYQQQLIATPSGKTVHLMQPDTFDQFEVPLSLWGEGADFLVDSLTVDVHFFEDQAIAGMWKRAC